MAHQPGRYQTLLTENLNPIIPSIFSSCKRYQGPTDFTRSEYNMQSFKPDMMTWPFIIGRILLESLLHLYLMFDIFYLTELLLDSATTLSQMEQRFFDPSESWKLCRAFLFGSITLNVFVSFILIWVLLSLKHSIHLFPKNYFCLLLSD